MRRSARQWLLALGVAAGGCASSASGRDAGVDVVRATDSPVSDATLPDTPGAMDATPLDDSPLDALDATDVPAASDARDASRRDAGNSCAPRTTDGGARVVRPVRQAIVFEMPRSPSAAADAGVPLTPAQIASEMTPPLVILARNQIGTNPPALRAAGVTGPFLQYLILNEVNGPLTVTAPAVLHGDSGLCNTTQAAYLPEQNNVMMDRGAFCAVNDGIIHGTTVPLDQTTAMIPSEGWFLHNASDHQRQCRVIDHGTTPQEIACRVNPGNTRFQTYFAARAVRELQGAAAGTPLGGSTGHTAGGMDGIFLDNVSLGRGGDAATDEYPNTDAGAASYAADVLALVTKIRSTMDDAGLADRPLMGNMIANDFTTDDAWNPYCGLLDGAFDEYFALDWGTGAWDPARFDRHLTQSETWINAGLTVIDIAQGRTPPAGQLWEPLDQQDLDLSLAAHLLVTDGVHGYYRFFTHGTGYQWYFDSPEYAETLGAPTGARTHAGTTWTRDFQCGSVSVTEGSSPAGAIHYDAGCTPH